MRYTFKNEDIICYSIPQIGNALAQFLWSAKWGERAYNFYRYEQIGHRLRGDQFWKYEVAKSKIVQSLYKKE